ncbi:MAG: tRNA (N6-isopentenyl adenosine(37)-C2)-methylthiotransferase MiaB, partial [Victivallales bacterium]|nr:tRNA (N6-isopentenyl adenosine(37)-C2)-methylthiotransferase MiaB [Victivallales bacterium]
MNVFIKTYGCQMNERDSEAVAGMLSSCNYHITENENDADILIFNTCSVREQAERKAIGKIGFMKKLKQQHPALIIGVMGCMAQNIG